MYDEEVQINWSGLLWLKSARDRLGAGLLGLLIVGVPMTSVGAELTYEPINPSFGGPSLNSSHLIGLANLQNKHLPSDDIGAGGFGDDPGDQFVRTLQSRLLSELANQTVDAIFGEDADTSGEIVFGDQTITFVRDLTEVRITIFDAATGATTDVAVPVLQTGG